MANSSDQQLLQNSVLVTEQRVTAVVADVSYIKGKIEGFAEKTDVQEVRTEIETVRTEVERAKFTILLAWLGAGTSIVVGIAVAVARFWPGN